MASSPPDDGILPEGWTWGDVGHGALDVVGLVPLLGEAADLANAGWYAAEGKYLDAGLSIVSMVPVVGDVIGKGGKLAKKGGGMLAGPALKALKTMDFKKMLEPLARHPKIGPHVEKIAEALEKWRKDIVGEAPPCTPAGNAKCPLSATASDTAKAVSAQTGISPAKVDEILATPKKQRPDPKTYVPADQYAKHIEAFDQGGSRLMLKKNLDKYGPGREDGTSFLMTKAEADKLLEEAGGDLHKLEDALGLPRGQLDGDELVRVDFPKPRELNIRIPSGNEAGANSQWLPGGKLPDGNLEAVIDIGNLKPGQMVVTPVGK